MAVVRQRVGPRVIRGCFQVVVVLAMGAGLVGCSSAAVSGRPTADAASALPGIFDSCTALTDADIRSYGLDPATKKDAGNVLKGIQFGCGWENSQLGVDIIIQDVPAKAFTTNPALHDVTPIDSIRPGSFLAPDIKTGGCAIAIPVGNTSVIVGVSLKYATFAAGTVDPCTVNKDIAQRVVVKVPE